jgi:hypothetical protein
LEKAGEKTGIGSYVCIKGGEVIRYNGDADSLPPWLKCNGKKCRKK